MGTTPNDIRLLLNDCEYFIADILQDEQLSEIAEDAQKKLLNNFRLVRERFPLDFSIQSGPKDDEGSDDNRSSSLGRSAPSDTSENQDDWIHDYVEDIPMVAVHELNNVIKQSYLEKRRKDHSFFSSEWQKRWCVLNNSVFYYFSSEKDKQQKGCFDIRDYDVQLVTNLRKDSKRNSCFELSAPGRQVYQISAPASFPLMMMRARSWRKTMMTLRRISTSRCQRIFRLQQRRAVRWQSSQIMPATTSVCGIARRTSRTSWPSAEETSSASLARS
ncbi:src kinase-associated phosphoprotein 1 isoform 2-T2 [Synchiropus picturatus]